MRSGIEVHRTVLLSGLVGMFSVGVLLAPHALADDGWIAAASSPNHEQLDWGYGPDQMTAEYRAMSQCAVMQRANDCLMLASSPDCVAVVWDDDQPLNHAHGFSGGGREVVLQAGMAEVGPYANGPEVRCTWEPHS